MHQSGSTHHAAGDVDIGGLAGGADDAGKVKKIPVVWRMSARENQSAGIPPHFRRVVVMGIVQGKHDLGKGPGGEDGQCGQRDVGVTLCTVHVFGYGKFGHDGAKTCDGHGDDQRQYDESPLIVFQCAGAHSFVSRPEHHLR